MKLDGISKPIIAADIDGVVADFNSAYLAYLNNALGRRFTLNDWTHYDLDRWSGLTIEQLHDIHNHFINDNRYCDLSLVAGAKIALGQLSQHFQIVWITARPKSIQAVTRNWCRQHFPNSRVLFANPAGEKSLVRPGEKRRTKVELAEEIKAHYLIEDNPHEFAAWDHPTIQPVCFACPWNSDLVQSHPHIPD